MIALIPYLNKASTINEVGRRTFRTKAVDGTIIVDDGFTGCTREELRGLVAQFPDLDVMERRTRALGKALLAGFARACDNYAFDRLVILDADMSRDPAAIPNLLAVRADIVSGSRYVNGGAIRKWPTQRRLISLSANFAAKHLMNLPVDEMTSGFRVYSKRLVEDIVREAACGGYEFQPEAVWIAASHSYPVSEAAIIILERKAGDSKRATMEEAWKFYSFVLRAQILSPLPDTSSCQS